MPDAPAAHGPFVRHGNFSLNQDIQVEKLVNDASINNCEFSQNNSDQNVNIKCSAGFYKAVAMPAFSSLSPGFSHLSPIATITCSNIEPSVDYKGIEFNRIFWFSARDSSGVSASITVHLHHTTRMVQVQGSAILSDGSVAAVWFVKNLLLGLFLKLGKERGHDISSFNQAVLNNNFKNICSDPPSSPHCPVCQKPLRKPAKPVKCFACKQTFHTKCHKQHPCNGTPSRPPTISRLKRKAADASSLEDSVLEITEEPTLTDPGSSVSAIESLVFSPAPSLQFLPNDATGSSVTSLPTSSSTSLTPPSVSTTSVPTFHTSQTWSISNPISSLLQMLPTVVTSLPPPLSSACATVPSSSGNPLAPLIPPPTSNPPPPKRQRKAAGPAVSEEAARQEFLKIQLNLAQTKISSQDATIKRKDESISILSERLRLLELGINNQMFSQYFPTASAPGPPPPPPAQAPPCSFWSSEPPTSLSQVEGMTGSVARPDPSATSPPVSSVPAASVSCSLCPATSRNMELLLSEINLLKQQTSSMHENISKIREALQYVTPQSFSSVSVSPNSSSNASQSISVATRHTQTRAEVQKKTTAKKTSDTVRPIRPLFSPCPWLGGSYPPGPVRNLGPPRPRRRSRSPRPRPPPSASSPNDRPPSLLITEIHDHQHSPPRHHQQAPVDARSLNY